MTNLRRTGAAIAAIILASSIVAAGSMPAFASAAPQGSIDVFPGPNALTDALAQANPGDTLVLHTGIFDEAVTISTPSITIEPAGDGPVTIDGRCSSVATVNVRANHVRLRGAITVEGGQFYELNYLAQTSGSVTGFTLNDTCHGTFGIFLQDTGAVSATSLTVNAFAGGGIEIYGVTDTGSGRLLIARNEIVGAGRGILIQNSAGGAIELLRNRIRDAVFSGISLMNSDGVLIRRNRVTNDGTDGIGLDANSDSNRVVANMAKGNTFDLSNLGQGNCFERNRFHTSEGVIGC
jgi:nitrous oxidase accessory protein NosD